MLSDLHLEALEEFENEYWELVELMDELVGEGKTASVDIVFTLVEALLGASDPENPAEPFTRTVESGATIRVVIKSLEKNEALIKENIAMRDEFIRSSEGGTPE